MINKIFQWLFSIKELYIKQQKINFFKRIKDKVDHLIRIYYLNPDMVDDNEYKELPIYKFNKIKDPQIRSEFVSKMHSIYVNFDSCLYYIARIDKDTYIIFSFWYIGNQIRMGIFIPEQVENFSQIKENSIYKIAENILKNVRGYGITNTLNVQKRDIFTMITIQCEFEKKILLDVELQDFFSHLFAVFVSQTSYQFLLEHLSGTFENSNIFFEKPSLNE